VQDAGVPHVLRWAAFTRDPAGGNPAGVVLDAAGLTDAEQQRIAADVGFSETAFLVRRDDGDLDVRYFSPRAEVPFCGHATIAAAVAHAQRHGPGTLRLHTRSGLVEVRVADGSATLTSVATSVAGVDDDDLDEALGALGWTRDDLDPALPPAVAFAGAHHLVLAVRTRRLLRAARLDLAADRLAALTTRTGWTTLQLVHRTGPASFEARNPFPPGGVVEDPATGAAAAALGAHLRTLGAVDPPVRLTVHQGAQVGRPGVLLVDVPDGDGAPVAVTGSAVELPAGPS
jgi:PhzF family phenazine biosynthesis protein